MKILFLISFMILILITNTSSFAVERFSEIEIKKKAKKLEYVNK